ncbi:hypothetical protein CBL13_00253 [Pseudomonas putida]|nr:hypothetical protein CBL13_00253 [Pseudomonas putida]
MATIRTRKKADGSTGYLVQIRIYREKVTVYQESQTFARKQAAVAWVKRRETKLSEPGAIERANRVGHTVKQMIDRTLGPRLGHAQGYDESVLRDAYRSFVDCQMLSLPSRWLEELSDQSALVADPEGRCVVLSILAITAHQRGEINSNQLSDMNVAAKM